MTNWTLGLGTLGLGTLGLGTLGLGTLGLAAALLGPGTAPAQAAISHGMHALPLPPHRAAHPTALRHAPAQHIAMHHAAMHHVIWHHPAPRHIAWHHPLPRHAPSRIALSHRPIWHHAVWHHAVWHRPVNAGPRMSCVPFARAASGIDLAGNAYEWWGHAAGRYARGDAPVPGSVLAFRANVRMRLGHVAVVSRVVNRREVEVDQANWADWGQITRGVRVIDVSEDNTWTDVRVAIGAGRFGSVYPTYGFIYDRPDSGTMIAANRHPAPILAANPPPANLRALDRGAPAEVAEAPGHLPNPPRWPTHLAHTLHTRFVHRDIRHVAYRQPWAAHRTPAYHVVIRHAATHHATITWTPPHA